MSNFAEDIEKAAGGAEIVACVIGSEGGWGDTYGLEDMEPHPPAKLQNVALRWDVARSWLDRSYHTGFGSPSCWAIYAWTDTKVIFVSQYDGATQLHAIPCQPTDGQPSMPGG